MIPEPLPFGFPRGEAARVIRISLERFQLGQRIDAALERNLGGGDQLAVFGDKLVFLLHIFDDFGRKRFPVNLRIQEQQAAVLLFKIRTEGGFKQGAEPFLFEFLDFRTDLIPELDLTVVEFIPCIDGVADIRQGPHGFDGFSLFLLFQEDRPGGFVTVRVPEAFGQLLKLCLDSFGIRAGIRHFRKFHHDLLLCTNTVTYIF